MANKQEDLPEVDIPEVDIPEVDIPNVDPADVAEMFSNMTEPLLNNTTDLISTATGILSNITDLTDLIPTTPEEDGGSDANETPAPASTFTAAPTAEGSKYVFDYVSAGFWRDIRQVPRVGHSDQIAQLFGTPEEQADYILGIMFLCGMIFVFFTVWGLALLILKCCGKYKVGYLSGGNYKKELKNDGVPSPRPLRGRICFGLGALMFIIWGILFAAVALTKVESTAFAIADTSNDVHTVLSDADMALDTFTSTAIRAEELRQTVDKDLQNAIEALESSELESAKYLADTAKEALVTVENLHGMAQEKSGELKETLGIGQSAALNVESTMRGVDYTTAKIVSGIFLTVIPFLMLVIMGLIAFGINNKFIGCFTQWFLLPVFVLLLILMYFGCSIWAAVTIADADFCAGGAQQTPEGSIDQILRYNGYEPGDMEYNFGKYVLEGCTAPEGVEGFERPDLFLEELEAKMRGAISTMVKLNEVITGTGVQTLTDQYGFDFAFLEKALIEFRELLADVIKLLKEVLMALVCQGIARLYTELVHNATCTESTSAFVWVWASMFVMTFSGFFMLTFRAALYPVEDRGYHEEGFEVVLGAENGGDGPNASDDDQEKPATATSRYEEVGDDNPFKDQEPMGGGADEEYKPAAKVW